MTPKAKRPRLSRSTRAGIIFPVSRVHRQLKSMPTATKRITQGASIYLSAVIEYLVAELLELSGNAARDCHRSRIIPRHILLAYANDDELYRLLRNCVVPEAGVLPSINLALFPHVIGQTSNKLPQSKSSISRGTKKTVSSTGTTAKASFSKPSLTKKGQGSFSILGTPTSKAAAVKDTAVTTLSERVLVRGQKLTVVQGSIVNIKADAIVHPTNDSFYMGGDVGKALIQVGRQQLRDAVTQAAKDATLINAGDVTISAAPNLSASHLIHVFSPKWNVDSQEESIGELDKATLNILTLADQQGLTSVAIPSISSGRNGFPKQTAAQTILAALSKFFRQTATTNLQHIFFVLYDAESVNVYTTELQQNKMAEGESKLIDIQDNFFLHGDSSKQYIVKLSTNCLSIYLQNNENQERSALDNNTQLIPIDDIYGCLCMKDNKNPIQCHLNLYLYSLQQAKGIGGSFSKKTSLQRSQFLLTYAKFNDYESNLAAATRWHYYITTAIYLRRNLPPEIVTAKRDKRALVFVNPAGGAGKAYRHVMEHVIGVWSEAEFTYHIIMTEYAGHARDYVHSIQISDWSGIVVASGDGLIYEVINGLMNRQDWQEALKLPIGHLPCGSGNAFITNIIRYSQQPIMKTMEKFIVQAAVLIATHNVLPFDMAVVDICDGQRYFSFLCIEWAIVADVDCDSEKYRFLGGARFTVEAIKRIIQPRTYNGYIDYIPHEDSDDTVNANQITPNTTTAQIHQHLLPLNEPIPTDSTTTKWRRINGPFIHVLVTSKAAMAKDTLASPKSTLSDGYLTLQYIRADDSIRMNLAKTFSTMSDGKHLDYDFVEWMPIRAFRIVPNDSSGNMMIDGEKVAYGPIQAEILPSLGRCMGKQPKAAQVPINP
ncbi:unnamed protein product [Rotaria sp. Silwood2]|nr:unnamed protein product [Rotaria sp. Silwood2]CAF3214174.1 unnamed protein product [Rotaria sp. Silwood2]CAF3918767.1 unnamed protein product [Rotaria sp. Silwood2]CAF4385295.1 unnamed protein product [Rotaria sp. Silwood2]